MRPCWGIPLRFPLRVPLGREFGPRGFGGFIGGMFRFYTVSSRDHGNWGSEVGFS